jgi:hypothetical protein
MKNCHAKKLSSKQESPVPTCSSSDLTTPLTSFLHQNLLVSVPDENEKYEGGASCGRRNAFFTLTVNILADNARVRAGTYRPANSTRAEVRNSRWASSTSNAPRDCMPLCYFGSHSRSNSPAPFQTPPSHARAPASDHLPVLPHASSSNKKALNQCLETAIKVMKDHKKR